MGRDFRFITTTYANHQNKIYFELDSIENNKLTAALFLFCSNTFKSGKEIVTYMVDFTGCTIDVAKDYLLFLIDSGILMPATNNNIIGKDYLQVLLDQSHAASPLSTAVKEINRNLENLSFPDASLLKANADRINKLLSGGLDFRNPGPVFYAGLERSASQGSLFIDIQNQLRDGLKALSALVTPAQPGMLPQFIEDFKVMYDKQKIPLLQAVDPDIGIGYGTVTNANLDSDLLRSVKFKERKIDQLSLDWSEAHRMLFKNGMTG
ncbi:lantibiotic dehydratase [Mucilaginibacter antarcticus]|uniref:lantibiotic dehydratase n=1 Tax=Mucilaginibacter antarcticus TaxID=1855725 RepID=UPI00362A2EE6